MRGLMRFYMRVTLDQWFSVVMVASLSLLALVWFEWGWIAAVAVVASWLLGMFVTCIDVTLHGPASPRPPDARTAAPEGGAPNDSAETRNAASAALRREDAP